MLMQLSLRLLLSQPIWNSPAGTITISPEGGGWLVAVGVGVLVVVGGWVVVAVGVLGSCCAGLNNTWGKNSRYSWSTLAAKSCEKSSEGGCDARKLLTGVRINIKIKLAMKEKSLRFMIQIHPGSCIKGCLEEYIEK